MAGNQVVLQEGIQLPYRPLKHRAWGVSDARAQSSR
jgi:hypothetical protein